ncbi:MAG: ATP-binding protein [Myxococcota bacterium]
MGNKRVASAFAVLQAVLVALLGVHVALFDDQSPYLLAIIAGAVIYLGFHVALGRGFRLARQVTVVLITLLTVVTLREPYLTQVPSFSLFIPPVIALILTSPSWVIGVVVFEIAGLSLRAGWQCVMLQPQTLMLFIMVMVGIVFSRTMMEGALLQAEAARADAERKARELLEEQRRAAQLEEELRHSQRLESLGRLAGGVAHDFNNLLTVIGGSASLAEESLEASHLARRDLQEIQNAATRAADLTRQLLAFARRQILVKQVTSLHEILEELERMLTRLLGEKVRLETRRGAEEVLVDADRGQVLQVFVNLVVNARDAMPDGGTITISLSTCNPPQWTSLEARAGPPRWARVDVEDTGHGMSEEIRARLFEPFFTTKGLGRGTGLGLATSFGIIKQHEGHITIDSTPGRGSRFSVFLPLSQQKASGRHVASSTELPRGHERVLLVEDDVHLRGVAVRVLREAGYQVDGVGSAEEAVGRLEAEAYDAVVSDVVMPGKSGLELMEHVTREHPDMGVVLMSGYADTLLDRPRGTGRSPEFLQKPFPPRALLEALQRALMHRTTRQPTRIAS